MRPVNARDRGLLDKIGRLILRELQLDARLSAAELGRRVGLSAPAAGERVRRLEEAGVVTGYTAVVDPEKLGYTTAFLHVAPSGRGAPGALSALSDAREVVECHRTTGPASILLKAALAQPSRLESLVDRLTEYGTVTSATVLSTVVPVRGFAVDVPGHSRPRR